MNGYQYGVVHDVGDKVERQPRRRDAEEVARSWVLSPLRTGPRKATVVRRRGWDGAWAPVASWTSPEGH